MTEQRSRKMASHAIVVTAAVVLAFAIDQLTKAWAIAGLSDGTVLPLIPTVRLKLIFNPGVAFGMDADFGAPLVVGLMVIAAGLAGWVIFRITRSAPLDGTVFLALALGGAAGNIWDRISRAENGPLTGEVIDFFAVEWFAIFNVADIFTTCGIALWVVTNARADRREVASGEHRS